jgi:hypothetical protein
MKVDSASKTTFVLVSLLVLLGKTRPEKLDI